MAAGAHLIADTQEQLSGLTGTPRRSADVAGALTIAALYLVAFLILASVLRTTFGFPLDDSYIHQTVARNLAYHHVLGFLQDRPSSGSTSLLWEFLQAANYAFLGAVNPILYNLILSAVMLPVIGSTLYLLARRDGLSWKASAVFAAAPALCGNFLWLGLIGMEHLFFVAFSLLAVYFWFSAPSPAVWKTVLAGTFCGLVVLSRPEAVIFAPLLMGFTLVRKLNRRPLRDYAVVIILWLVATALVISANFWTSGTPMPATLKGRSWLYFHTTGGAHSLGTILRFVGSWVQKLPRLFSTHFVDQLKSPSQIMDGAALIGIVLLIVMIAGAVELVRRKLLSVSFVLLWAFVHFLTYLATFPAAGHGGRYQPIVVMLLFPLLFFGFLMILRRALRFSSQGAYAAVALLMVVCGIASISTWRKVTVAAVDHINHVHGEIGRWMQANLPPSTRVAAFDIGRVSYDWSGQIVDLGGLVDPSYYHYLVHGQVPQYLRDNHIQYVMLPGVGTRDMGFINHDGMEVVFQRCSDTPEWMLAWRYTINATQCQEVDRLLYSEAGTQR